MIGIHESDNLILSVNLFVISIEAVVIKLLPLLVK